MMYLVVSIKYRHVTQMDIQTDRRTDILQQQLYAQHRAVQTYQLYELKKTVAIAQTARVTRRSVIAEHRLTLTVILNMAYVNFISPIELTIRKIL